MQGTVQLLVKVSRYVWDLDKVPRGLRVVVLYIVVPQMQKWWCCAHLHVSHQL